MRSAFEWRYQTTGPFPFVRMGGDRFFIHEHQGAVVTLLSNLPGTLRPDAPRHEKP